MDPDPYLLIQLPLLFLVMSTITDVSNNFGESDKARVEAYVSALQHKYPQIDGNELSVLQANELREKLLYDSIEKEKESLR